MADVKETKAKGRGQSDESGAPDKFTQLIPAQIMGLYMSIHSAAETTTRFDYWLPAFAGIIALIFYAAAPKLLGISGWKTRALYCATFLIWVVNLEVAKIQAWCAAWGINPTTVSFLIAGLTLIWTGSLTIFYPKGVERDTSIKP